MILIYFGGWGSDFYFGWGWGSDFLEKNCGGSDFFFVGGSDFCEIIFGVVIFLKKGGGVGFGT